MKKVKSRRHFIQTSMKAGLALPLLGYQLSACTSNTVKEEASTTSTPTKLRILILGGTSFLGPHQIAYALSRGHEVSTFTRGKTKPSVHTALFQQVTSLIGDRENDLSALEKGTWDLVIDNSGRKVAWTEKTANLLKDRVGMYLYTSSTGVYFPYLGTDIKEDTELLKEVPATLEDEMLRMEYDYGVMKTNSEIATINAFGADRSIIVRPTYMIGPADKTNRFIHWPIRLSKGGEMMVPGKQTDAVQYADVRDVAEWMIRLAEQQATGIYNAVGPVNEQTMPEFVQEAQKAFDVSSSFVYIDDYDFLKSQEVYYLVPWIMQEATTIGTAKINNTRAIKNGLTLRPIKDTILDTLDWWKSDAVSVDIRKKYLENPKSILARETAIIKAWNARS